MQLNTFFIYPMFALVVLTCFVGILMVTARFRAVAKGEMKASYFKTYDHGQPTEFVTKSSRNFSNLFELPVLFYAGCIVAMILPLAGWWPQFWAWLFVVTRFAHSFVHIGPNKIVPRMSVYVIGFISVLVLWIEIILAAPRTL